MIHEVPDPQPLDEVRVTNLSPVLSALAVQNMSMEDYAKVRHLIVGPAMVEWKNHYLTTGSLT